MSLDQLQMMENLLSRDRKMPKPGDWRMSVEVLQAGQPRPYADSIYHYRVFFETIPFLLKDGRQTEYEPSKWIEEVVIPILKGIHHWYDKPENWASTRLSYVKNTGPGLWEFVLVEPFTD